MNEVKNNDCLDKYDNDEMCDEWGVSLIWHALTIMI